MIYPRKQKPNYIYNSTGYLGDNITQCNCSICVLSKDDIHILLHKTNCVPQIFIITILVDVTVIHIHGIHIHVVSVEERGVETGYGPFKTPDPLFRRCTSEYRGSSEIYRVQTCNAQKEGWLASWKAGLGTCPSASLNFYESNTSENEHHCAVKSRVSLFQDSILYSLSFHWWANNRVTSIIAYFEYVLSGTIRDHCRATTTKFLFALLKKCCDWYIDIEWILTHILWNYRWKM